MNLEIEEMRQADVKRGVAIISSCLESAPYVDYRNGILRFPAPYASLLELGSCGFSFSYIREFGFESNKTDFVCSIPVDGLFKHILKNLTKSSCYVTFQKKAQKK